MTTEKTNKRVALFGPTNPDDRRPGLVDHLTARGCAIHHVDPYGGDDLPDHIDIDEVLAGVDAVVVDVPGDDSRWDWDGFRRIWYAPSPALDVAEQVMAEIEGRGVPTGIVFDIDGQRDDYAYQGRKITSVVNIRDHCDLDRLLGFEVAKSMVCPTCHGYVDEDEPVAETAAA